MEDFILYILLYLIIFVFYMLYFLIRRKNRKKMLEVIYMESKYKVDFSKIKTKDFKLYIALLNSFIFTITIFIMSFFNNFILKTLMAFASVMILILVFYKLLSLLLNRKK